MSAKQFAKDGTRLTDCCGARSTYCDETLCCKVCYNEVPVGQGDGSETLSDITRKEIKQALGVDKFSLKSVSFQDLARGNAYVFSIPDYDLHTRTYLAAKRLFDGRTYNGARVLVNS